jgi:hypothetical protein
MRELRDVLADYRAGRPLTSFKPDELREIGKFLIATSPAYTNPKDPLNKVVHEEVREVYEAAGKGQDDAAA